MTTETATGTITPATLTASITNDPTKSYDCTTTATLAPNNFSISGLVGGENFTVTKTAGLYNSPNVVSATTVTASLTAGDLTAHTGTLASDYTLPTRASGTGSITAATATISVTPYSVTYDGNAHTATGTATGVGGESLSGLNLSGTTHTNAGTYTGDAWTFTDTTGNYNTPAARSTTASPRPMPRCRHALQRHLRRQLPHSHRHGDRGGRREPERTWILSGTTHTNAGTYNGDTWTFTDTTGNYNNASGTVNDSIAKAKATILVTPYSVTYDGNAHTATGTATGVGGVSLSGTGPERHHAHQRRQVQRRRLDLHRHHRQLQQRQRHGQRCHQSASPQIKKKKNLHSPWSLASSRCSWQDQQER